MEQDEILETFRSVGAILTDTHVVYVSGLHGSIYINKDALYPHTTIASRIGEFFALKHRDLEIDVVAGPALGGIILSQWTAHHLSRLQGREILSVYTEKTADNNQVFTRGYDQIVKGKKLLVVEDTTNTGMSVKKVVGAARLAGADVEAVAVIVNRSPDKVNSEFIGAPFSALLNYPAEAFSEADCPLCRANVPINTTVGHGRKFLEQRK